eukprot:12495784-Ditylum_brightwellii.AAC.1
MAFLRCSGAMPCLGTAIYSGVISGISSLRAGCLALSCSRTELPCMSLGPKEQSSRLALEHLLQERWSSAMMTVFRSLSSVEGV